MSDNESNNSDDSINNIKNMDYELYVEKKYINNIFKNMKYLKNDSNDLTLSSFNAIDLGGTREVYIRTN